MDVKKIGSFLAELRRQRGLTQEQLGEKLGVTNKTVSRWENGNYLPPVEMLQDLSELYGLSINELISGQRLTDGEYRQQAEENIKSALAQSSFTLKEKIDFFKRKWRREHIAELVLGILAAVGLYAAGILLDEDGLYLITALFSIGFVASRHNRMMTYVESHAFDGTGVQ